MKGPFLQAQRSTGQMAGGNQMMQAAMCDSYHTAFRTADVHLRSSITEKHFLFSLLSKHLGKQGAPATVPLFCCHFCLPIPALLQPTGTHSPCWPWLASLALPRTPFQLYYSTIKSARSNLGQDIFIFFQHKTISDIQSCFLRKQWLHCLPSIFPFFTYS